MVLTVRKKRSGEVIDAVYKNKEKSVKMVLRKTKSRNAATTEIKFSENSKPSLTVSMKKTECGNICCLGTIQVSAKGKGVNYQMMIDFKSSGKKNKSKDFARVKIKNNKTIQSGYLNLNTRKVIGCKNYGLMNALSDEQIKMIESFKVPLKSITRFYGGEIKSSALATYSVLGTGEGLILLSLKGSLCRAACWAAFSAAAIICCGGTAGIACAICTALAAADASLCADLCPP